MNFTKEQLKEMLYKLCVHTKDGPTFPFVIFMECYEGMQKKVLEMANNAPAIAQQLLDTIEGYEIYGRVTDTLTNEILLLRAKLNVAKDILNFVNDGKPESYLDELIKSKITQAIAEINK